MEVELDFIAMRCNYGEGFDNFPDIQLQVVHNIMIGKREKLIR